MLRFKIIAPARPRHLEIDTLPIGAENRKEDSDILGPEFFLHPVTVFSDHTGYRHRLADLAALHMDHFQITVRAGIPVLAVNRNPRLCRRAKAKLAVFH